MTAGLQSIEMRVSRRLPVRVMVEYSTVEDFLIDYSANVSMGGMFIRTPHALPVGTRFRLRFRIPEYRGTLETCGEVRWISDEDEFGALSGMGVRFDTLNSANQKAVEGLFRSWRDAGGGAE